jgi:DNA polymerase-3 subunit delta'
VSEIARHPRETSGFVGHEAAEAVLRTAWKGGRMPHAWIFAGAEGIGKATLAYSFARTVLAAGGSGDLPGTAAPEWDVPPDHPLFRRVAAEAHSDLKVLVRTPDPKTGRMRHEIVVDDARRIAAFFSHTAAEGGWRVAIVDTADDLNDSSANALLKIVEEPPERGLILLLAHRPGALLPTLRSRCRLLRMAPLSDTEVARVLAVQWPELEPAAAAGLIAMAEGSLGRAIALGEADGYAAYGELVALLSALPEIEVAAAHRLADRLTRREAATHFPTLAGLPGWWLGRMIRSGAGVSPGAEVVPGEAESFARVVGRAPLWHWAAARQRLVDLVARGTALNLDRKQLALNVFTLLGRAARGQGA